MKKLIPFIFPTDSSRGKSQTRVKRSMALLALAALCGAFCPEDAAAQYVWNGTDGTEYSYSGTANPPWASDSTKTGKWISNAADARVTGTANLGNASEALTVENSKVTFTGRMNNNSSLTINSGSNVSINAGLWMANGNYTPTLTINEGGTLNVTGSTSYISDNPSAHAYVIINGGTFNFLNEAHANFGHHGALTMEIKNNGTLNGSGTIHVGAGDQGSATTNIPAERTLTIGTAGSAADMSTLTAKQFYIGTNANAKVILESGSIISDGTFQVGNRQTGTLIANGGTIQAGGDFHVGNEAGSKGFMDLKNVTLTTANRPLYFANKGTADVKIANSSISASSMVVANNPDTANGTVLIKDSTLTLTSDAPIFHKKGTLTLDNVELNSTITGKDYTWGDQSVDSVTELKNMSLTFSKIFRINAADSGSTTMVVGEGAHLDLQAGFWMAAKANTTAYLEIQKGGKVSVTGTSYLSDHRTNANGKVTVSGGTFEADTLNVGWWGPLDMEISNGGKVDAAGIAFNSNTSTSDPADTRTGDLTISGNGSLLASSASIYFGHSTRDQVTVNLKAADTGFGQITAKSDIVSTNVSYILDASAPIILQEGYSAEKGVTLMSAGGTISAFTGTLTSGNWTAALSADKKTVTAKQNSDALGTVSGSGNGLTLQTPAETGWVWLDSDGTNPFQLTMTVDGLADMDSMNTFVDFLNESFTTLNAEAVSEEEVLFTNLGTSLEDAVFAWDFSSLTSIGLSDLAVTGFSGQNVPEPGTWILLLLGAAGIWTLRKQK